MSDEKLYFKQLLAGRDFAKDHVVAGQMVNFVYLVGDREKGECVVVDPAWNVKELLDIVEADDMRLTGVLATHYHPDHVGGDLMGACQVEGIAELLESCSIPVYCQKEECEWICRCTGVSDGDLRAKSSGDVVEVGDIEIKLLHTPGHTPGSQCFLVENRLVAGDTLFLDGCGRTDLPGGDPEELFRSLHQRLAKLPDDTVLFPGHLYSPEASAPLGDVRHRNHVFQMTRLEDWQRFMG